MVKPATAQQAHGPLELMEEACHLLRQAAPASLLPYLVGTAPFVLALLYFTSDMSRSPFASGRLAPFALVLALLFLWMKAWQTVYADRLLAVRSGHPPSSWPLARIGRMVAFQACLQPLGFILLPAALLILLPFGWTLAFFGTATVLGSGEGGRFSLQLTRVWRQTFLWPRQNHVVLLTLKLFYLVVLINLALLLVGLPWMAKVLLGWESVFTLSPTAMLNSTFFICLLGLAYLCVDPLLKAVYVLRCFYGESLQSGLDLKIELAGFRSASRRATPLASLGLAALLLLPAAAGAGTTPPQAASELPLPRLDETIDTILQQREYSWRLPREGVPEEEEENASALTRLLASIGRTVEGLFEAIGRGLRSFIDWLRQGGTRPASRGGPVMDWFSPLRFLLLLLIAVLVVLMGLLLHRAWKKRALQDPGDTGVSPPAPAPNVADETVGADQLPEEEWITLARQLASEGQNRLALRAYYLASLAHLADRNLVGLAKFKSNRDYQGELRRRAHALPGLLPLFQESVAVFDRVWYGLHDVSPEGVDRFAATVHRIRQQSPAPPDALQSP